MNQLIANRRSIRNFRDKPVEREKMETLLRAAMQAPSAGNQQPWSFIVVTSRKLLDELSDFSPYAGPLKSAPAAIICMTKKSDLRFAASASQDLSASVENILLQAVELDLGSVWLGVYPEKERMETISRILSHGDTAEPFAVIAVGYPAGNGNHFTDRFDPSRISWIE